VSSNHVMVQAGRKLIQHKTVSTSPSRGKHGWRFTARIKVWASSRFGVV